MIDIFKELQKKIDRKQILINEPMSKHTSFKIGGIADFFVKVFNVSELKFILEFSKKYEVPITIVGNGTNLLVRDKGIRGIVLKLEFNEFKIERNKEKAFITVGAGFPVGKLANIALKEEFAGLEFLAGIPGTIGGAIRMNAGAYGKEMKDIVVSTKYMQKDGKVKKINLDEHEFIYRNSIFSKMDVIILETVVVVEYGKKEEIQSKIDEYMQSRIEKQPLQLPNAGSTFKRIEGVPTARLIDECGLKGYRIGDAAVSEKHAGFVVNLGTAKASEVIELTNHVKEQIKQKFNKEIQLEVLVIGEE